MAILKEVKDMKRKLASCKKKLKALSTKTTKEYINNGSEVLTDFKRAFDKLEIGSQAWKECISLAKDLDDYNDLCWRICQGDKRLVVMY